MARPRVCWAGEKVAILEVAHVEDGRTRVEREETTLGNGACRDNIANGWLCSIERRMF